MKTLIPSKISSSSLPLLPLCVLCALCGYVFPGCSGDPSKGYTTNSMFSDTIKTVAVSMFDRSKDVYRRDVEIRLTEAIQKRVQQNTPYRLAKRGRADSELTGELVKISQQVLSYNGVTGQPNEMEAVFTINFTWKDRHGNVLVKRDNFQVSGTYIPGDPFNETFFQGGEDIINRAAKLIVEQMESDW
jgi:rubredoxin